jgi:anti-sigma factor RsiW
MSDMHPLSGAYAVDALDDIERARFERHLAECPDCTAEVASLREAAAMLAHSVDTEPSADLRAKVLAEISTVRPLPPQARRRRSSAVMPVDFLAWWRRRSPQWSWPPASG